MAHPEPASGAFAVDYAEEEEEGYGSYPAHGSIRGSSTPATSMLSTSSFSPPRPLVLLAVRPLGRVSCCGDGMGVCVLRLLVVCCRSEPTCMPRDTQPQRVLISLWSASRHPPPSAVTARRAAAGQRAPAAQRGRGARVQAAGSGTEHCHQPLLPPGRHKVSRPCRRTRKQSPVPHLFTKQGGRPISFASPLLSPPTALSCVSEKQSGS